MQQVTAVDEASLSGLRLTEQQSEAGRKGDGHTNMAARVKVRGMSFIMKAQWRSTFSTLLHFLLLILHLLHSLHLWYIELKHVLDAALQGDDGAGAAGAGAL